MAGRKKNHALRVAPVAKKVVYIAQWIFAPMEGKVHARLNAVLESCVCMLLLASIQITY